MAQPAVLYMFDKEITMQTSLDNEKKKLIKRQELDLLFAGRKGELLQQKENLKAQLGYSYQMVNKARENFIAETDGSGGTGKIGIKDIAIAKRNEYQKLEADHQRLSSEISPKLDSADKELYGMEASIKKEEQNFIQYLNNGFLTRVVALNNLIKNNPALQFRYYLIVFILMLIELMPVIAKTILPSGSYDEKVLLREEMEIEIANSNIRKEKNLKEIYNQLAFENDTETIKAFFSLTREHSLEKIKTFSNKWKEENHQTFDGFWEKMKREVLTKQEN